LDKCLDENSFHLIAASPGFLANTYVLDPLVGEASTVIKEEWSCIFMHHF
jgi:hypothetical protein